jgi:hypothetical protein
LNRQKTTVPTNWFTPQQRARLAFDTMNLQLVALGHPVDRIAV